MTRDQMIAWLCLEGWSVKKRFNADLSLMRDRERIHTNAAYIRDSAWYGNQYTQDRGWRDVDDGQLEIFYEAARLL